jgi:cysteine synthase A
MISEPKSTLYISIGVLAGILLTLGFKDVYPDLERRYKAHRRRTSAARRSSITGLPRPTQKVTLEDHTKDDVNKPVIPHVEIAEGIEGCIGNTPLFKIKSLSEETGCEIFAKAEVHFLP